MKITEITDNKDKVLQLNVFPDVIKNRFDILHPIIENSGGYMLYCVEDNVQKTYIPVFFNDTFCELGVYMRKIDKYLFEKFVDYLFKTHKKLQVINVLHTLTDIDTLPVAPHWHIDLPESIEEFDASLGKRTRKETKYKIGLIKRIIGEFVVSKYDLKHFDYDLVKLYLSWKHNSHNFLYKSAQNYIRDFHVTSMYVLKTAKDILAIEFISETNKEDVFAENFSYNVNYRDYSVGIILYYHVIKDLIKNQKKRFYLLGGNYEYKKNYNGVCTMTRSGNIYRHPLLEKLCRMTAEKIKLSQIPCKKFIINVIRHLFISKYYKKRFKQIAWEGQR